MGVMGNKLQVTAPRKSPQAVLAILNGGHINRCLDVLFHTRIINRALILFFAVYCWKN